MRRFKLEMSKRNLTDEWLAASCFLLHVLLLFYAIIPYCRALYIIKHQVYMAGIYILYIEFSIWYVLWPFPSMLYKIIQSIVAIPYCHFCSIDVILHHCSLFTVYVHRKLSFEIYPVNRERFLSDFFKPRRFPYSMLHLIW